jgi:hypothetical protein
MGFGMRGTRIRRCETPRSITFDFSSVLLVGFSVKRNCVMSQKFTLKFTLKFPIKLQNSRRIF